MVLLSRPWPMDAYLITSYRVEPVLPTKVPLPVVFGQILETEESSFRRIIHWVIEWQISTTFIQPLLRYVNYGHVNS